MGSKDLAESPKEQRVEPDETLVSFDASALFTSIPVQVAPEVINSKFIKYTNAKRNCTLLEKTCFILKDSHLTFGISS